MTCTDGGPVDFVRLRTGDGDSIALHDLTAVQHEGTTDGPAVLLSHATGFCAHVWEPVAGSLSPGHRCLALDYRGYGDSDPIDSATLTWRSFGVDAETAAGHCARTNGPVIGVGHSMGGAALVSAALERPDLFRALFLYEPIIFPPPPAPDGEPPRHGGSTLADGARKRRRTFPSIETALENFASKPPLGSFDSAAREGYVRQGFRICDDGSVEMKCTPEHEARTYETSAVDPKWERLADLTVPCWVMAGKTAPMTPAAIAPVVAEQIPGCTYVQWDELGHFGPLEHPEFFAGFVARTIATLP